MFNGKWIFFSRYGGVVGLRRFEVQALITHQYAWGRLISVPTQGLIGDPNHPGDNPGSDVLAGELEGGWRETTRLFILLVRSACGCWANNADEAVVQR